MRWHVLDVQMIAQARTRDYPKLESVLIFVAGRQVSLESTHMLSSCTNSLECCLLLLLMSPKSKKCSRKHTEPCAGCRHKFTPTGYWQHLRQTTKLACIAVHDAEARYRPLPDDNSASHSTSPSLSPSPSSGQLSNDEQAADTPAQLFEGDYYGDYQAHDFDDFDEFDANMEVDRGDPIDNMGEGELGSASGEDNGGARVEDEGDRVGSGRGDIGVAEGAAGLSQDDSGVEAADGLDEGNDAWRASSVEDNEDDEEKEEEEEDTEEDANFFEKEGAWEPPPLAHPPFNADLDQDHNLNPSCDEDGPGATSASRQHAQDRLFRKTFVVHFPGHHAGMLTPCAPISPSYAQYQHTVDTHSRNPYALFQSAVDRKVAHWAKMHSLGSTAVTELLQIEEVSRLSCCSLCSVLML